MTSYHNFDSVSIPYFILTMITGIKPTQIKKSTSLVSKAKQFPIQKMYPGELKTSGGVLIGPCPFHKDDTPSFALYIKTNTWHCFSGCTGSDAIDFYMKLHKIDFNQALKELTNEE